jgi:hypothetical protein
MSMEPPHVTTSEGASIMMWVLWSALTVFAGLIVWFVHDFLENFKEHKKETAESFKHNRDLFDSMERKLNDEIVGATIKMNVALEEVRKAAHSMKIDTISLKASADKFEMQTAAELAKLRHEIQIAEDSIKRIMATSEKVDKKTTETHDRTVQVIQAIVNMKKRIDAHDEDFKTVRQTVGNLIILKSRKQEKPDADEG